LPTGVGKKRTTKGFRPNFTGDERGGRRVPLIPMAVGEGRPLDLGSLKGQRFHIDGKPTKGRDPPPTIQENDILVPAEGGQIAGHARRYGRRRLNPGVKEKKSDGDER